MDTETILLMSGYMCVCMLLFDMTFTVYGIAKKKLIMHRKKKLVRLMSSQLERLEHCGKTRLTAQIMLGIKLAKPQWLGCFVSVAESFSCQYPHFAQMYLYQSLDIMRVLIRKARRADVRYRTQLVYVVYIMNGNSRNTCTDSRLEKLKELSMEIAADVVSKSAALRANAFRTLVSIGDLAGICHAFELLNADEKYVNIRIMANDLLELREKTGEFLDAVCPDFPNYCPSLKACIIDFMALIDDERTVSDYVYRIASMLENEAENTVVRLAALHFFCSHHYEMVYEKIVQMLNMSGTNYPLAASAALALSNYPCEETKKVLAAHLASKDWYVRFNCADSLLLTGTSYDQLPESVGDEFAQDMFTYRRRVTFLRRYDGEKF